MWDKPKHLKKTTVYLGKWGKSAKIRPAGFNPKDDQY
jgi:hypothetical protein